MFSRVLPSLEKSKLVSLIFHYLDKIQVMEQTVDRLSEQTKEQQEEITRLQLELGQAQRGVHRQAAPFRKEETSEVQDKVGKKIGRSKGHKGSYRQPSGVITESIIVPLDCCPHCQSKELSNLQSVEQIIEELDSIKLRIVALQTQSGYCQRCDKTVRSRHPLQVSHAIGAAKVQIGPRATSMMLKLHHRYGLTVHKVSEFFTKELKLPFSAGGVCHLEHRMAQKLIPNYDQLWEQALASEVLQGDETGWYVGQVGYYLFVITNDDVTIYDIQQSRAREKLSELLKGKFPGIFVSDCLNMYDEVSERQQKCYSHHLKAVKEGLKILPKSEYLLKVKALLKKAIEVKKMLKSLEPPEYQQLCEQLEQQADELFPNRLNKNGWFEYHDPDAELELEPAELSVAKRIAKQRPHLFTFLYHEKVPATNNLSERQLRPAVIQRKLSCGNKTEKGAMSWKIIRSIIVSDYQNEKNFEDTVLEAIQRDLNSR